MAGPVQTISLTPTSAYALALLKAGTGESQRGWEPSTHTPVVDVRHVRAFQARNARPFIVQKSSVI